ncbi:MAG: hypothetical protein WD627_00745 [Actinomycetota bacterium]
MAEGHGEPLKNAAAFEALPEDIQEEIRSDVALLRSNLPPGELSEADPVGIGVTSGGLLIVKTAHAAYQLMEDGSTLKATGGPAGMELITFRDGMVVDSHSQPGE